jgi:hypothetical protein
MWWASYKLYLREKDKNKYPFSPELRNRFGSCDKKEHRPTCPDKKPPTLYD